MTVKRGVSDGAVASLPLRMRDSQQPAAARPRGDRRRRGACCRRWSTCGPISGRPTGRDLKARVRVRDRADVRSPNSPPSRCRSPSNGRPTRSPATARRRSAPDNWLAWVLAAPVVMTLAYGGMRIVMALLTQWRDGIFAKVAMNAVRRLAMLTFEHMHLLSLRFHLERKTGGLTRVLERGRNAIETIVRMMLLQLAPTIVELVLIVAVLLLHFDWRYVVVIVRDGRALMSASPIYATEWRINIRRKMNDSDTDANAKAIELAAQLRDRQIFLRRGARGQALRPLDGALRGRQRQGLCLARRAQCRAGGDLHHRACRGDGAVRLRHRAAHQHGRRFRHDQRHDDPALPAAEFHGHGLSRDQTGGDRHRDHVHDAGAQARDRGPAGRAAAAACAPAPSASRTFRLPTSRRGRSSKA